MNPVKKWTMAPLDERYALAARQRYGVSDLVARILYAREIPLKSIPSFLAPKIRELLPDPADLLDMKRGAERVVQALQNHEKITIYGDYDVDGATSVALLWRYFDALGQPSDFYIPDRLSEGYGVNANAFQKLIENGTKLVICVDCGTGSVSEIKMAQEQGVDVIVLDHHIVETSSSPALAFINAFRLDQPPVPFVQTLCSAGLVFLFLTELQRQLRQKLKGTDLPKLISFCDLVALGTVCDVMPLTGLNRAFVRRGLEILARRENLGLRALMDVLNIHEAPSAYHLGFILGPRINAGGRVGTSSLGVQLLTTKDPLQAQEIAQKLNAFNTERQKLETQAIEEARAQIEPQMAAHSPILLVGGAWHPGVVGIAASRLKETYARPVFVAAFQENDAKGSARSVEGFPLGTLIHKAIQSGILKGGGGHAMAGGFTVERDRFEDFRAFLNEQGQSFMETYTPLLPIDSTLSVGGATLELLQELETLEPYGAANPRPRFCFHRVKPVWVRKVGAGHIQCFLEDERSARLSGIAFRALDTPLEDVLTNSDALYLSVVGTLTANVWQGKTTPQLMIEDARPFKNEA